MGTREGGNVLGEGQVTARGRVDHHRGPWLANAYLQYGLQQL